MTLHDVIVTQSCFSVKVDLIVVVVLSTTNTFLAMATVYPEAGSLKTIKVRFQLLALEKVS